MSKEKNRKDLLAICVENEISQQEFADVGLSWIEFVEKCERTGWPTRLLWPIKRQAEEVTRLFSKYPNLAENPGKYQPLLIYILSNYQFGDEPTFEKAYRGFHYSSLRLFEDLDELF